MVKDSSDPSQGRRWTVLAAAATVATMGVAGVALLGGGDRELTPLAELDRPSTTTSCPARSGCGWTAATTGCCATAWRRTGSRSTGTRSPVPRSIGNRSTTSGRRSGAPVPNGRPRSGTRRTPMATSRPGALHVAQQLRRERGAREGLVGGSEAGRRAARLAKVHGRARARHQRSVRAGARVWRPVGSGFREPGSDDPAAVAARAANRDRRRRLQGVDRPFSPDVTPPPWILNAGACTEGVTEELVRAAVRG